jgi:LemA protein
MANELDELTGPTNDAGREISVINQQIAVKIGFGTILFELAVWLLAPALAVSAVVLHLAPLPDGYAYIAASLIPGLLFQLMKVNALAYLRKLQQKIQADASQIDSFLEQRVVVLQNLVGLVQKSIDVDKEILETVTAYRSGGSASGATSRNEVASKLDGAFRSINVAVEAYPDIKAHAAIAEAIQQNIYLQREITAARALYNDTVAIWNQDIFSWPTKQIVAARAGYTTRIPFIASAETKMAARGKFF